MKFLSCLTICFASLGPVSAKTYHVDPSATPGGEGESWESPFGTLQGAMVKAVPGDTILLAQGIYVPTESPSPQGTDHTASFLIEGGGITIRGGYSAGGGENYDPLVYKSVLSGDFRNVFPDMNGDGLPDGGDEQGSDNIVRITNPGGATVLEGLWIVSGYRRRDPSIIIGLNGAIPAGGAGVLADEGGDLRIDNCHFRNNNGEQAAGLAIQYDTEPLLPAQPLVISNSTFRNNGDLMAPNASGGAIYARNHSITLTGCEFSDNVANSGAALFFRGTFDAVFPPASNISGCQFKGNFAQFSGGAIFTSGIANFQFTNNLFSGNHAGQTGFDSVNGGAISAGHTGPAAFRNNTFAYNSAGGSIDRFAAPGGAVSFTSDSGNEDTVFAGNLFHHNYASNGLGAFPASVDKDPSTNRNIVYYGNYASEEELPESDPARPNHTQFIGDGVLPPDFLAPLTLLPQTIGAHTRYLHTSAGDLRFPFTSHLVDLNRMSFLSVPFNRADAAGAMRSLGFAPDPGAFEAQPPPGTPEIIGTEFDGVTFKLFFVSDSPVSLQSSLNLTTWPPPTDGLTVSPLRFGYEPAFPDRFFRLSTTPPEK